MTPLEHVGTLYIENQRLLAEYQKLLELFNRVKSGEVRLEQVAIDLPGSKWSLMLTGNDLFKVPMQIIKSDPPAAEEPA